MYIRKLKNIAKGFNTLAPVYSRLVRVIFGNSLQQAQLHFVSHIHPTDRVLILGGGDGTFLKALLARYPELHVDYIDLSPRMIALAKQKVLPTANVTFITGSENDIPGTTYSVVITHFYLDLFSETTLPTVIEKINAKLRPGARWLAADFVNETWWHDLMLWVMYRFFRLTTGIEAKRLPNWQRWLTTAAGKKMIHKKFYRGFVTTMLFYR